MPLSTHQGLFVIVTSTMMMRLVFNRLLVMDKSMSKAPGNHGSLPCKVRALFYVVSMLAYIIGDIYVTDLENVVNLVIECSIDRSIGFSADSPLLMTNRRGHHTFNGLQGVL